MQKKNNLSTILLVIMLLAGLSLLLYPTFSNWWNSRVSSYAVTNYIEQISNLDSDQYKEIWDDAAAHNTSLLDRSNPFLLSMEQETNYYQLLDVGGTGIMGYIEIPSLQVTLPLYHGTSESVLQVAVGHLEWTSLPVGGESTHCVLSGHRGLPSARLFTDLDKMMVGDLFMLHILDETLTYEVDQILIVYPEETEDLMIQEGKDLVTLVTCTPYGINTHRILVRGHRVDNIEAAQVVRVTADALVVEKLLVAPFLLAPLLLVLLIVALIPSRNIGRGKRKVLNKVYQVPYGTKDILPGEMKRRRKIENAILDIFENWGYEEVKTPGFEYADTFGSMVKDSDFRFFDRNNNLLVLRNDMTAPIARLAATRLQQEEGSKRLCYFANLYRYEEIQMGRQCEFEQAGVEFFGAQGAEADAEIIALAVQALQATGLETFAFSVGHVGFINGLAEEVGFNAEQIARLKDCLRRHDAVGLHLRRSFS